MTMNLLIFCNEHWIKAQEQGQEALFSVSTEKQQKAFDGVPSKFPFIMTDDLNIHIMLDNTAL